MNLLKYLHVLILITNSVIFFAQSSDDYYISGSANYINGEYEKAVENFSIVINRNNSNEIFYIKRGAAFLKINLLSEALKDFEEANLINPHIADLWIARAHSLSGNNTEAIKYLKLHLTSGFKLQEDSIIKDPAFNHLKNTDDWELLWQGDWYSDLEKTIADINYYVKKNKYEEALDMLNSSIIKWGPDKNLLFLRGETYLKSGNYANASSDFTSVVNEDDNSAMAYAKRGYAYLKAERFKQAINDFNKALKIDPAIFTVYLQRAEAFAGQKEWSLAIKDMLTYLKYFNNVNAVYKCGEYYYESSDYINALKFFNLCIKDDSSNPKYFKARGKTYLNTSTYQFAISDLAMSLDLDPNDAETWMFMGLASIKSGDKNKACSSLNKAQELGNTEAIKHIIDYCK